MIDATGILGCASVYSSSVHLPKLLELAALSKSSQMRFVHASAEHETNAQSRARSYQDACWSASLC